MSEFQKRETLSHFACRACGGKGEHFRSDSDSSKSKRTERNSKKKKNDENVSLSNNNGVVPIALNRGPRHLAEWEQCPLCKGTGLLRVDQSKSEDLNEVSSNIPLSNRMKKLLESANIERDPSSFTKVEQNDDSPLVVVAGCGIAGAALTLALLQRGIRVICFERDDHFAQRSQGYGLTMQQGGTVLRALGVYIDGVSSSAHHSWTHDGKLLGSYGRENHEDAQERAQHNLQVPRQRLRESLVEQIPYGNIKWGVRVTGYSAVKHTGDENQYQKVCAHLSDGTSINCTILVGCDGIRSTIRTQKMESEARNSTPLRYLGVMVLLGYAKIDDIRLRGQINQSSDGNTRFYSMPFSGNHGKQTEEHDEDSTMWQLSFPFSESDSINLANGGSEMLLEEAVRRCGSWHGAIPDLLKATNPHHVTGYPVYDRDLPDSSELRIGHGEDHDSYITLLGDAAHPMSPFKGQGANQALIDALMCARSIADSIIGVKLQDESFKEIIPSSFGPSFLDIPKSLDRFEDSMLVRVRPKVRDSHNNVQLLHSPSVLNEGNAPRAGVAASSITLSSES